MRKTICAGMLAFVVGSVWAAAQTRPAAAPGAETFQAAPDALERVTWRTRTLVGDDRITKWRFGLSAESLRGLTLLQALVTANAVGVNSIEGSSTQKVSAGISRNLGAGLTADEIATVKSWMKDAGVQIAGYRVDALPADAESRKKLFAFAKSLGVQRIVVPSSGELAGLEKLEDEFGVKVVVFAPGATPARLLKQLDSSPLNVAADTGVWAEEGIAPRDALAPLKSRLAYVYLRDRSGTGRSARNVLLGTGTGRLTDFFHELNRLNLRPLILMLDTTGVVNSPSDLLRAVDAFEAVVQPAYGMYFTELSRAAVIRKDIQPLKAGDTTLSPEEVRQRIEAAIPAQAYVKPKKPRKLLVIDACMAGMSHNTIPHANIMLERMGKMTGAWEAELNNDLNNLKYPRIKQYDAVFLNSNVGELLPDPEVRAGLARFVREGGGLGGVHGTPWASRNWDEFGDMIGAKSAPHRIEQGIMKVFDPNSPITKPFGGRQLDFREEYYRFQHDGPNRLLWEKVRVLLTVEIDIESSRPWNGYKRPDNVYPVTWIRSYGKGRVFYCSLGHMPETFMTPEIVGHFLAGVQFMLGDLEADTTPNASVTRAQSK